ncbi:MAG: HAMP domain-containing sensor histidine kinase [Bacteroidota bacterium]|nr:HAMP domain-containing sensor histidine kinase [Bacteroidota bacterium]
MTATDTTIRQRSSIEELYQQSKYFSEHWNLQFFANAVSEYVTVLNKNRQIVFSNEPFAKFLGSQSNNNVVGMRPGEALRCAHAGTSSAGCGTTEFCKMCGAFQAIMQAQIGKEAVRECRILRDDDLGSLDFLVRSTPMKIENQPFTLFALSDISHEKRRKVLENIFFHDVLNTAGGLMGYLELLPEASPSEKEEFINIAHDISIDLTDQIQAQRELANAENSDIVLNPTTLHSLTLLPMIASTYRKHRVSNRKQIVIDSGAEDFIFVSDEGLMKRILGNLTKNALEASQAGDIVTIGCKRRENEVQFWVHNSSAMPRNVQLQMFQRSFSTKGGGRGLGTYSVKLLTERWLHGHASFVSNTEDGTIFFVTLSGTLTEQTSDCRSTSSFENIFA